MIWIFDENLRRIKILRQYEMAQWSNKFRDVGTFTINARYVDENLYLLDKTKIYYVLLYMSNNEDKSEEWNAEHNIFGKIEKVSKEDEQDADFPSTIKVEGRLMPFLLTKRVIKGTMNFTNVELLEMIRNMIYDCFKSGSERYVKTNINSQKDTNIYNDTLMAKQITGGQLWDEIKDYLENYKLGIVVAPTITKTYELSNVYENYMSGLSNVKDIIIKIKTGVDRTRGNGLKTVIFSKSLSNIKRTSYSYDSENDMNVAYIAGEGEGEERKWFEIQKNEEEKKNAWNREELWIDARDIQSEQEDETKISDEEYEKLIQQRAEEKFQENNLSDEYTSTINEYNERYVYTEHYDLGDWVTVQDKDLGIEIDAQIVEVTTTLQNNEIINDIVFEYGKVKRTNLKDLKNIKSDIQNVNGNLKYISKKINKLLDMFYPIGSIYETMEQSFDPSKVWGGTWERIKGRVLVGVNESDTDFNSANKTGGEKTHVLSQLEIPSHDHSVSSVSIASSGSHIHTTNKNVWVSQDTKNIASGTSTGRTTTTTIMASGGAHTHNVPSHNTNKTGGGKEHNNLQPYITCYIWKRTA